MRVYTIVGDKTNRHGGIVGHAGYQGMILSRE